MGLLRSKYGVTFERQLEYLCGPCERNLYKMWQFYLAHKILSAPAVLNRTQHVELLPVMTIDKTRVDE